MSQLDEYKDEEPLERDTFYILLENFGVTMNNTEQGKIVTDLIKTFEKNEHLIHKYKYILNKVKIMSK